ncbi:sensor histidine kinase [Kouleothrix sp.]|uniref:sensor histidine kinase n=1 Tax=Kouleothrix sp. TaxID=2779161 RepID=UPI00391DA0A3
MLFDAPTPAPPHDRRWLLARMGWLALCAAMAALFAFGQRYLYAELLLPCAGPACWNDTFYLTAGEIAGLRARGYSPSLYAAYQVGLYIVFFVVHVALATLIVLRRPGDRVAQFTAFALLIWSATFPSTPNTLWAEQPALAHALSIGAALGGLAFFTFLFVFPNGRFPRPWMRLGLAWMSLYTVMVLLPEYDGAAPLSQLLERLRLPFFSSLVAWVIAVQIYRYRSVSSDAEREQTRWALFGILGGLCWNALIVLYAEVINPGALHGVGGKMLYNGLIYAGFLLIPISLGAAILRRRLWDIDQLIGRTLVYGALTAGVVGGYVLIVGYLGTVLRAEGNLLISLLATGVVAVLFQPLRERVQRGVNRLLYGERDDPYAVVARLGRRLEAALAPEAVLPTLAETVAVALRRPYAAILLRHADVWQIAAEYGAPQAELQRLPLLHQGETIGQLLLAPRMPGEPLDPADRRLLAVLAQQAGAAAHAVRLTRDLQATSADLQHARARLVAAREEERRRIRRDLHDGVGPALSGLIYQLEAARNLVPRQPDRAVSLLGDLKGSVSATLADIRRLVYALRPPALDELGLVAAIRDQAARYHAPDAPQITIDAPERLPALPAAVEVAAYRIALEALTNVTRHAQARSCRVSLALVGADAPQALCLEVADDGVGIPSDARAGVGLASMRERAAELGGTCLIEPAAQGGTRLCAWLPLPDAAA